MRSFFISSVILALLFTLPVFAEDVNLAASKVLAVVPVKSGDVDQSVYRKFDRLVPELKRLSKNKIVKLECRYSGQPNRQRDVDNAYKLAGKIEKYLRVRHKLELDLWVSIDMLAKSGKASPVLTIAVFPDAIKKLEAVLADPQGKQ